MTVALPILESLAIQELPVLIPIAAKAIKATGHFFSKLTGVKFTPEQSAAAASTALGMAKTEVATLNAAGKLSPVTDQGLSALIETLYQYGKIAQPAVAPQTTLTQEASTALVQFALAILNAKPQ